MLDRRTLSTKDQQAIADALRLNPSELRDDQVALLVARRGYLSDEEIAKFGITENGLKYNPAESEASVPEPDPIPSEPAPIDTESEKKEEDFEPKSAKRGPKAAKKAEDSATDSE